MRTSGLDLVLEREDKLELQTYEKIRELTDEEYFDGLLNGIHKVVYCKLTTNDKLRCAIRPENAQVILEKYFNYE